MGVAEIKRVHMAAIAALESQLAKRENDATAKEVELKREMCFG